MSHEFRDSVKRGLDRLWVEGCSVNGDAKSMLEDEVVGLRAGKEFLGPALDLNSLSGFLSHPSS